MQPPATTAPAAKTTPIEMPAFFPPLIPLDDFCSSPCSKFSSANCTGAGAGVGDVSDSEFDGAGDSLGVGEGDEVSGDCDGVGEGDEVCGDCDGVGEGGFEMLDDEGGREGVELISETGEGGLVGAEDIEKLPLAGTGEGDGDSSCGSTSDDKVICRESKTKKTAINDLQWLAINGDCSVM